jgi:hypothetical protein
MVRMEDSIPMLKSYHIIRFAAKEKSGSRCLTISFPIGVRFEIFFRVVILSRFSDMIWISEEQNWEPLGVDLRAMWSHT